MATKIGKRRRAARPYYLPQFFTRYPGWTPEEIARTGDREYVEWLASDAITDPALRKAARAALRKDSEEKLSEPVSGNHHTYLGLARKLRAAGVPSEVPHVRHPEFGPIRDPRTAYLVGMAEGMSRSPLPLVPTSTDALLEVAEQIRELRRDLAERP